MKKFFIKFIILIFILVVIDQSLSRLLDLGRPIDFAAFIESKSQFDELDKVDIIFTGDSQAADCFVPSIFNEKLGVTSFNYGVYIMAPFEEYFLIKDLVERHKTPPKLVVIGTNIDMFNYKVSDGRYTPMFIENPLNLVPLLMESDNFSSFTSAGRKGYLFPGMIKAILSGKKNTNFVRNVKGIDNGYLINVRHYWKESMLTCKKERAFWNKTLVPEQQEYLEKSIQYLKENNIDVILVNPPVNKQFLNCVQSEEKYKKFNSIIKEIKNKYNIVVYNQDHTLLTDVLKDEDFFNGDHLCYPGAEIFSNTFADYLKTNGYNFNSNYSKLIPAK